VYAIEVAGNDIVSEVPKKARFLLDSFGLELDLFPKLVRS